MLRDYQRRAIDMTYDWLGNNAGNPCLVLPTGAGKSHIVAAMCKEIVQGYSETRILMLSHQKELIGQNAEKMRLHWPNAPLGIYSAGMNKRQIDTITFASIQSVAKRAASLGSRDVVIIDECFTAGTKILTPSGEKDIDKVRCGDIVYNLSGCGVVEAVSCKPAQEIYTLELSNGRSIQCTPNHPFFTSEGWKRAEELENGSSLYGIQAVHGMWSRVQTLDKERRERKSDISTTGTFMEKAEFLLNQVCKEIQPNGIGCSSQEKDQRYTEKDKTSAYKAWRKRAIASFASVGTSSCSWGWLGCRTSDKNPCGTPERCVSECLQGGYSEPRKDDSDRVGRREPRASCETITRSKENGFAGIVRVVSVSSNKRKSAAPVYNLQVSGHPSYFANGVAVHNCHMMNNKESGNYRTLLAQLMAINPALRVIGLTATPYRLGQGKLTDGDTAIFSDLVEPVTVKELVERGFLAPLKSKHTSAMIDTSQVKKRGGEYIADQLQGAADAITAEAISEIIDRAEDRKHWLLFCAGVAHAQHCADELNARGIPAGCLDGTASKGERERILSDFTSGKLKALTNCDILTTGFDFPDIDLIAFLRPTMSPALYVQMAGRGMRLKSHTDHCLVLDFAGNVERHGPIVNVEPPKPAGKGGGEAPAKTCPQCDELLHTSCMICPECGHEFPKREKELKLSNADIMGIEPERIEITDWRWSRHVSRKTGKEMVKVKYYSGLTGPVIDEYFCVMHEGIAGMKARAAVQRIAEKSAVTGEPTAECMDTLASVLNTGKPPSAIEYRKNGKFYDVQDRIWTL